MQQALPLAYAYHGGALADVRRLAFALMYALVNDCHLVGRWPMYKRGGSPFPKLSTLTTSPELRRRCYADKRLGLHCYFRPISTCTLNETIAPEEHSDVNIDKRLESDKVKPFRMDHTFFPHKFLDKIIARTGLHSEVLIMGTLIAWIMRPPSSSSKRSASTALRRASTGPVRATAASPCTCAMATSTAFTASTSRMRAGASRRRASIIGLGRSRPTLGRSAPS